MGKDYQKVRPFADPGNEWVYASAGAISDTNAVELKAAVTGKRNYLCALQLSNTDATVATIVQIISGASTVLWQFYIRPQIAATQGENGIPIEFPVPLRSATGEALSVKAVTTSAELYVNAQGYTD